MENLTRLPAGKYYVADLCHIRYLNDNWGDFCEKVFDVLEESGDINGSFEYEGHKGWVHSTYEGDGGYPSNTNTTFDVDSGTIGIIQVGISDINLNPLLYVFESDDEFEVYYKDGEFHFGGLTIYTNLTEDDEDL